MKRKVFQILISMVIFLSLSSVLYAKIEPTVSQWPNVLEQNDENPTTEEMFGRIMRKIEREPFNYENYSVIALLFDSIGEYEAELGAMERLMRYLPEDAEGKDAYYGNYARAFFLNDMWKEGKDWLDMADKINPDNLHNRWNAFEYYFTYKKDYSSALKELKRLNAMVDEDDDPYYDAYLKISKKDLSDKKVISFFEEAVKQEPNNHKTHRVLGAAIRNSAANKKEYLDKMPVVLEKLKKALELDRSYMPTYVSLGNTYYLKARFTGKKRYFKTAIKWFNKGLRKEPDNARLHFVKGNTYNYMHKFDNSIKDLEFAYENGLQNNEVTYALASAYNGKAYGYYEKGKNLEEGLELIDKALSFEPNNGVIISTKAELLYKLGRYEEAFEYIKKGIVLEPFEDEIQRDFKMITEALFPGKNIEIEGFIANEKVRIVEKLLSRKGYDPGKVDGILDLSTREAVEQYQNDNGLEPTRFIDQATWDKLFEYPKDIIKASQALEYFKSEGFTEEEAKIIVKEFL